jgi:hypothetical protein
MGSSLRPTPDKNTDHPEDDDDVVGDTGRAFVGVTDGVQSDGRRTRLHWTRIAMNGLKPLTAGALSAVSVYTESRELRRNIQKINAGHPCDKAVQLRQIYIHITGRSVGGSDPSNGESTETTTHISSDFSSSSSGTSNTISTAVIARQLEKAIKRRIQQDEDDGIEFQMEHTEERRQWTEIRDEA